MRAVLQSGGGAERPRSVRLLAGLVLSALAVCGVLFTLHYAQWRELERAALLMERVRSARIDLAKGELRLEALPAAGGRSEAVAEGMVLIDQALANLAEGAIGGEAEVEREAWTRVVADYRRELGRWREGRGERIALRVSYGAVERLAERLDEAQRERLAAVRQRSRLEFLVAMIGTGVFFGIIGVVVWRVIRGEAQAQARVRLAAQATGVHLWEEDLRTGRLVWLGGGAGVLGLPRAPETYAALRARAAGSVDVQRLAELRDRTLGGADNPREEVCFLAESGEPCWAAIRMVAIPGAGGRVLSLAGSFVDITQLKRGEAERALVEQRFSRLFEVVPVGLIYATRDGRIVTMNRRANQVLGYTAEEISPIERWWERAYPDPESRRRAQENWARDLAMAEQVGTGIPTRESRVVTKDGKNLILESSGTLLGDELLMVLQDITRRREAEERSRYHEELLEETGRIAKVGGWSFDPGTGKGEWTREVALIHDLDPEAATAKEIGLSFYTPESRARIEEALGRAVREGRAYDLQLDLVSAKGVHKRIRTIGHPVVEQGRVVRIRGSFQDITELHVLSEERVHQQRRVALLADISRRLVISETSAQILNGIFADLAREIGADIYANYLVRVPGELLELQCSGGLTEEQGRAFAQLAYGVSLCGLVAQRRQPLVFADLPSSTEPQAAGIVALGVKAYAGFPLVAGGRLLGTISFGSRRRDSYGADELGLLKAVVDQISAAMERSRLNEALRTGEERFREVVENIREVFWFTDVGKQQIIYVSPGFETIWGRKCEELYLNPAVWRDSLHPGDRERVVAALSKQAAGEYDETYRVLRPDGTMRWVRDKAFPVKDADGRVLRVVGVAADITEERDLESRYLRAQRLEAIGTLASGVAHDLNNILAPVLMVSGLLRDKLPRREDRNLLEMMEQSAQRGARIVGQLLAFSRGLQGERGLIEPGSLLKEVGRLMQETLPRSIVVEVGAPAGLWGIIADATQVHQVLLNLCVNARDAMPEGGRLRLLAENAELGELDLAHAAPAKPGRYVQFRVIDEGAGIPAEILPRIFDPFFTTKALGKGTGLGLATVQSIVKGHQGVITVQTEPGGGTEFRVAFPVAEAGIAAPPRAGAADRPLGGGELILLVDDEEPIRLAARESLERHGYRVVAAANGEEAVRQFLAHRGAVRLVLTDLMMPVMGGIELARALRVIDPDIGIVACSGLDHGDRQAEMDALGIGAPLAKPFRLHELLERVRTALASRRARGSDVV